MSVAVGLVGEWGGDNSEGRHRRDLGRIRRHSDRAAEAWDEAKERTSRAEAARQRVTAAQTGDAAPRFGPDDIAVGDVVLRRGMWHPVIRVNRKSVTVPSIVGGSWTNRLPYRDITEVRRRDRASKPDSDHEPDQPGPETAD